MDKISIVQLKVDTMIGIHDWEQVTKQPVTIDLDIFRDTRRAAETDAITDTISYGDIARAVTHLVENSRFNLIETLADRIATLVIATFDISRVVITVGKPDAVTSASTVSVTIDRSAP